MDIKTKGNKQYSGKIPDVFIFKNGPTKDK